VRSIRALSSRTPSETGPVDVNALVADTLALVRAELRRTKVQAVTVLADGLPPVPGDRVQLQQVFINLVINAIEALAPITTRDRELIVTTGAADGGIRVTVEDSGIGVDPARTEEIFKALVTTKPDGMGMGLSIIRSIVELHGGRVGAAPRAPFGSVFELILPVACDGGTA